MFSWFIADMIVHILNLKFLSFMHKSDFHFTQKTTVTKQL